MPKPVLTYVASSTLEAMSLCAFARACHQNPPHLEALTVTGTADLEPIITAWKREVSDHRAYLRSLESVRACMGRRAA